MHSLIVQNTNHSEQRGQRQICGILVVTGGLDRNVSLGECLRRGTSFTGTPSCGNVLDPYCIGKVRQCGILDLDMYMNLGAVREVTRRHQRESRSGVIRCVRHIQIRGYTWFSTATTSTRAVHNAVEDQFPGISDEVDRIDHRRYQIISCLGHGLEGYQLRRCSIKHQCFPLEIVPHVGRRTGVLSNDPSRFPVYQFHSGTRPHGQHHRISRLNSHRFRIRQCGNSDDSHGRYVRRQVHCKRGGTDQPVLGNCRSIRQDKLAHVGQVIVEIRNKNAARSDSISDHDTLGIHIP